MDENYEMDDNYTGVKEGTIDTGYVITPLYNAFLIKKAEGNDRKFHYFHPSSFGGCLRKTLLQYYGEKKPQLKEPKEIQPQKERIFDAGHFYHERMQRHFAEMGILRGCWRSKLSGKVHGREEKIGIFRPASLEEIGEDHLLKDGDTRSMHDLFEYEEITLENKEYNFKGHCDGIIELERGNPDSRFVIDFKTCRTEKYEFLSTRSRKPDSEYITQISIYMWLSGVHRGIIFYEDKNNHDILEFHVNYSENRISQIKKTAKKLLKYIEKNQIAPVSDHYHKKKKPCCYCGYHALCFGKK